MKKAIRELLCIMMVFALMLGISPIYASAANYGDVSDSDWYAEAVAYVTEHGLMSGVGEGNFAPNQPLTRAQVVALLYRLDGSPETAYTGLFLDVAEHDWCAGAVAWGCQNGIVNGTESNAFSPTNPINREQLAAMLARYTDMRGAELPTAVNPVEGLKDSWYVSVYAEESVQLVWRTGIMNGDSQHNFNPKQAVTRADAAVILMRLRKSLNGESLTVTVRDTTPDYTQMQQSEKDALALEVARQIASVIPTDRSDLERVSIAAQIVSYYCSFCYYTMDGKDYRTPFGVFVKGEYSCAGATRALGLVLSCMGHEWTHVNENQYSHQWCELYMDGQLGYADGQIGVVGYGAHWKA